MRGLQAFVRAAVAASILGASGCVGLTMKPPKTGAMPRAESPSPLKIGVHMKKPRFEWQGMGGMNTAYMEKHRDRWMFKPMMTASDDVGGKFLRALQAASAFSEVDEVKSLGFFGTGDKDHDLIIDADFSGKYTQDPAGMGKALMTGFLLLLPAPFVRYDDAFFAAADMAVYDRTGRLLHKYSEREDVATSAALFSAGTPGSITAGIDAVSSNLAAKLVAALIADRARYQAAMSESPAVARAAAAEPAPPPPAAAEAVAAEAAAPSPAEAEPQIAKAAPEPEPAPRGPLTAAEESTIDEQVMP